MAESKIKRSGSPFSRFVRDYGMLGVLVLLCILFSILTLRDQYLVGRQAAESLIQTLPYDNSGKGGILIVARETPDDSLFAATLKSLVEQKGYRLAGVITGDPAVIRAGLEKMSDSALPIQLIATTQANIPVIQSMQQQMAGLRDAKIAVPQSHRWPTFLLPDNIRNVANQITVIAIIAIGMTMVIITAGIDLSVGSLIALSAVLAASKHPQW